MKEIIPVVHVMYKNQAKDEVRKIMNCGLKKCFLISHGRFNYKQLIGIANEIKQETNMWIGLNFLDLGDQTFSRSESFKDYIDAIWIDNSHAGVDIDKSKKLVSEWQKSGFKGIYFGGVAFKYCKQPENLIEATKEAVNLMDIVTTSGAATGIAADIEKIKEMKAAIGNKPLAIASGINAGNIKEFKNYVDLFLVASSIEDSFGNISERKLTSLIEAFNS